jgi:hypothetical protein
LDGQPSDFFFFLSGSQKLEQRAKKCIELRGEYAEQIPILVAVACFLPRRAKDLSAPPRTYYILTHSLMTVKAKKFSVKVAGIYISKTQAVFDASNRWTTFHNYE